MVFSLQVVKKVSPSAAQRQKARETLNVLHQFGSKDGTVQIGLRKMFMQLRTNNSHHSMLADLADPHD